VGNISELAPTLKEMTVIKNMDREKEENANAQKALLQTEQATARPTFCK